MAKKEKQKISIDGDEYYDDLTEAARAQLVNIQFVDAQLQR